MKLFLFLGGALALFLFASLGKCSPAQPELPQSSTFHERSKRGVFDFLGGAIGGGIKAIGGVIEGVAGGIAGLVGLALQIISGFFSLLGNAAMSLYWSIYNIPGGLPAGVVLPDMSKVKDGKVQDADEILRVVTKLIEAVIAIFSRGTKVQIDYLLTSKEGLKVTLPQIRESIEKLVSDPSQIPELLKVLKIDSIYPLYAALSLLKIHVQAKATPADALVIGAEIDRTLVLMDRLTSLLNRAQWLKIAISIVNSLKRFSGRLPPGIEIPDIKKLATASEKEILLTILQLVDILNKIFESSTTVQLNLLVMDKEGLVVVLPALTEALQKLMDDYSHVTELGGQLPTDFIQRFSAGLKLLKVNIAAKILVPDKDKMLVELNRSIQIVDALFVLLGSNRSFGVTIYLRNLLLRLPGVLPSGIIISNIDNIAKATIKDIVVLTTQLVTAINDVYRLGTAEQINFLLTAEHGLAFALPELKLLLQKLAVELNLTADLRIGLTLDIVNQLRAALILLRTNIIAKASVALATELSIVIDASLSFIDVLSIVFNPSHLNGALVTLLGLTHNLPGPWPVQVTSPDISGYINGNLRIKAIAVRNWLRFVLDLFKFGTADQINYLLTGKFGLKVLLPEIKDFIVTIAFDSNFKNELSILTADIINDILTALASLKVTIMSKASRATALELIAIIDFSHQFLDVVILSLDRNHLTGTLIAMYNLLHNLPGNKPAGIELPDTTLYLKGSVQEKVYFVLHLIGVFNDIFRLGTPEQIEYLLTGRFGLTVVLPELRLFLRAMALDPEMLDKIGSGASKESVKEIGVALALLKTNITARATATVADALNAIVDAALSFLDIIKLSFTPNQLDRLIVAFLNLIHNLPGTVTADFELTKISIYSTGTLKDKFNVMYIIPPFITKLLNGGTTEQVNYLLDGQYGLKVLLPQIELVFKLIVTNPDLWREVTTTLTLTNVRELSIKFGGIRGLISGKASAALTIELNAYIDHSLLYLNVIQVSLDSAPIYQALRVLASLWINLPGGLPSAVDIPLLYPHANGRDVDTIFMLKELLPVLNGIFRVGTTEQIRYLLTGEFGLKAILPNINSFLQALYVNPTLLKQVASSLKVDILNTITDAIATLKTNIVAKASTAVAKTFTRMLNSIALIFTNIKIVVGGGQPPVIEGNPNDFKEDDLTGDDDGSFIKDDQTIIDGGDKTIDDTLNIGDPINNGLGDDPTTNLVITENDILEDAVNALKAYITILTTGTDSQINSILSGNIVTVPNGIRITLSDLLDKITELSKTSNGLSRVVLTSLDTMLKELTVALGKLPLTTQVTSILAKITNATKQVQQVIEDIKNITVVELQQLLTLIIQKMNSSPESLKNIILGETVTGPLGIKWSLKTVLQIISVIKGDENNVFIIKDLKTLQSLTVQIRILLLKATPSKELTVLKTVILNAYANLDAIITRMKVITFKHAAPIIIEVAGILKGGSVKLVNAILSGQEIHLASGEKISITELFVKIEEYTVEFENVPIDVAIALKNALTALKDILTQLPSTTQIAGFVALLDKALLAVTGLVERTEKVTLTVIFEFLSRYITVLTSGSTQEKNDALSGVPIVGPNGLKVSLKTLLIIITEISIGSEVFEPSILVQLKAKLVQLQILLEKLPLTELTVDLLSKVSSAMHVVIVMYNQIKHITVDTYLEFLAAFTKILSTGLDTKIFAIISGEEITVNNGFKISLRSLLQLISKISLELPGVTLDTMEKIKIAIDELSVLIGKLPVTPAITELLTKISNIKVTVTTVITQLPQITLVNLKELLNTILMIFSRGNEQEINTMLIEGVSGPNGLKLSVLSVLNAIASLSVDTSGLDAETVKLLWSNLLTIEKYVVKMPLTPQIEYILHVLSAAIQSTTTLTIHVQKIQLEVVTAGVIAFIRALQEATEERQLLILAQGTVTLPSGLKLTLLDILHYVLQINIHTEGLTKANLVGLNTALSTLQTVLRKLSRHSIVLIVSDTVYKGLIHVQFLIAEIKEPNLELVNFVKATTKLLETGTTEQVNAVLKGGTITSGSLEYTITSMLAAINELHADTDPIVIKAMVEAVKGLIAVLEEKNAVLVGELYSVALKVLAKLESL